MNSNRPILLRGMLIVLFSACVGIHGFGYQENTTQEETDDDFNPKIVIEKKFPSIRNVAIRSMKTADKLLKDEELVLGVVINKHPRAYAINMLTGPTREIINDDLGGESIAATW